MKSLRYSLIPLFVLLSIKPVSANEEYSGVINTSEVIQATMSASMSCMEWEFSGVCVWMTCTPVPPACSYSTSIKVKNHVPDLLFQSYDRSKGEPYTESQTINSTFQGDADSSWVTSLISLVEDYEVDGVRGGQSTEAKKDKHANLTFKLVDAYGNPAILAFNSMANSSSGTICESKLTPFFPYYISNLDSVAWRWNIPEMFYPQSWTPIFNEYELGTYENNYGPIYPRHGFMTAQDPLKSAVLSSFRAAHFITRNAEPHVYMTIKQSSQDGYWPSEPLDQNDRSTGTWQMLYPQKENTCHQFPYESSPSGERRSQDGSYIWNFWKSYKCCEREGQTLIYHTG